MKNEAIDGNKKVVGIRFIIFVSLCLFVGNLVAESVFRAAMESKDLPQVSRLGDLETTGTFYRTAIY